MLLVPFLVYSELGRPNPDNSFARVKDAQSATTLPRKVVIMRNGQRREEYDVSESMYLVRRVV